MITFISKEVLDLNTARDFFVSQLKFIPTEIVSPNVGFLLQFPGGNDKVFLHLLPKCEEAILTGPRGKDLQFQFLAESDIEFEKLLAEAESKEVLHQFQDYLPYSDLGRFAIKGLGKDVYWVEKNETPICYLREDNK